MSIKFVDGFISDNDQSVLNLLWLILATRAFLSLVGFTLKTNFIQTAAKKLRTGDDQFQ